MNYEVKELIDYINNFIAHPIFPDQEAAILAAVVNGEISVSYAKQIYKKILTHNIEKHNELMSMSLEQIMELANVHS